jgi:hypothetical protein
MAKKKATRKKKAIRKKKAALRRKPVRANRAKRATKASRAKKQVRRRKPVREISSGSERSSLGSGTFETAAPPLRRGLGENAAGQSGDLQGLSRAEDVDSESVEELIEEGQSFEADVVSGVENAPDADEGEVRTHERPEDDLIDEGER